MALLLGAFAGRCVGGCAAHSWSRKRRAVGGVARDIHGQFLAGLQAAGLDSIHALEQRD